MTQRRNKRKRNYSTASKERNFSNKVFFFLEEKNFGATSLIKKWTRKAIIQIPKSFSISENPNESLAVLKELYNYGSNLKIKEIVIDHSECINLEIAASTIMDVIVLAIQEYHRKNKSEIMLSGKVPCTGRVKDVFMASGLAAHLKISIDSKVSINKENMELFQLKSGQHNSGISDSTATYLAEYIIRCMRTQGFTLNDEGRNALSVLFSEVLNNCEIHGGSKSMWFALGHYQINPEHNSYGEIQLVIFNFGNTIYEQMNSTETTVETKEKLLYLKERHLNKFSSKWNLEMLYSLFSLQEGISRLRNKDVTGNTKRGTGTIRLIENFEKIGQTCYDRKSLMTITSGNTHIRFDGKYSLKKELFRDKVLGVNNRKIIAFNKDNDIFEPPDPSNVYKLSEFFPGTIISLNFFFDKEYFKKITK